VKLSEEDFGRIEDKMREIIASAQPFERFEMPVAQAVEWARQYGQPYKEELLNDLQRAGTTIAKDLDAATLGVASDGESKVENVSFYRNGDFTDLCRGPHVESTDKVGAFKLMRVAGAYWRGKDTNPQMQRVYGVAFETEKDLRSYLNMLEEAKKRDHRRLGAELDLFIISDLVGSGLPLFTPRGTVLREEIGRFTQELREKNGFQRVWTPVIAKTDLYKTSGHWDKFGDELFLVKSQETSDEFVLRPMNCPHHVQIYASQPRRRRDLLVAVIPKTTFPFQKMLKMFFCYFTRLIAESLYDFVWVRTEITKIITVGNRERMKLLHVFEREFIFWRYVCHYPPAMAGIATDCFRVTSEGSLV
jgi:threonyl-tRNA synthetase